MKLLNSIFIISGLISGLSAEATLTTTGETVLFYQSYGAAGNEGEGAVFKQGTSNFNAGLQLNLNANLGNDFSAMVQGTFLGALGLEKNLVKGGVGGSTANGKLNGASITQAYLQKKMGDTTLKLGRMGISKKVSPFAYSEGWTPFKNSLDAIVLINTSLPETTLVGAYVSGGTQRTDLSESVNLKGGAVNKGAFMVTAINKSVPMVPLTLSYYSLLDVTGKDATATIPAIEGKNGNAYWVSTKLSSEGVPASLELQGGQVTPENGLKKTTAYGAKLSGNIDNFSLSVAYSKVDDGELHLNNIATNTKSPLYTQMILNNVKKNFTRDASTFVVKGVVKNVLLDKDALIAQYGQSKMGDTFNTATVNLNDYKEFDLMYKFSLFDMKFFTAYVYTKQDSNKAKHFVRVWSRYKF